MHELPLRRVAISLLVYALGAWVVLAATDGLVPLLALPPLFGTLVRAFLLAGAPAVAALAWRYPNVGLDREDE